MNYQNYATVKSQIRFELPDQCQQVKKISTCAIAFLAPGLQHLQETKNPI
jgi:hypothetical protein